MKNLFDETQSTISEYEMLQDSQEDEAVYEPEPTRKISRSNTPVSAVEPEEYEEFFSGYSESEIAYELEDEEEDVVSEAMVRLEQARLYDMLIKHDMFEGVTANPVALSNVKKELKSYIVERLQILLGIKQDTPQEATSMRVELPFNRMEIQALKDLAGKLTKGASQKIEERETVEAVAEPARIAPIQQPPKPQGLKRLSTSAAPQAPSKHPVSTQQAAPAKRNPPPPPTPAKNSKVVVNKQKRIKIPDSLTNKTLVGPDGKVVTQEDLEIARQQLEEEMQTGRSKNPYEMTHTELIERNKKIKGQTRSTKVQGLPMPSPDQVAIHYQTQQATRVNKDEGMASILNRVLTQK